MEKAQIEVYKRVYTDEQIEDLEDTEREAFNKKLPKFEKALSSLRAAREAKERRLVDAKKPTTKSKTKKSGKKEGLEGAAGGEPPALVPSKKEKPAPHEWAEEGENEFAPAPASTLGAPRSPLKRFLGIGGVFKKK